MKAAKTSSSPHPSMEIDPALLDWPRQAGLSDEFLQRVDARLRRRKAKRKKMATVAAGALGCLAAILWAVPYFQDTSAVTTLPAQRQALVLQDGSHADLNAQTSLHTDFRYGRRTVHLDRGEAFFAVQKDPAHPFLVITPAGTVRVTGTHFDVRLDADGQAEVTLMEGSVQVQADGQTTARLTPGEQFESRDASTRTLSRSALENVMAWRQGFLACDGLTLSEVATRLSAYYGTQITVDPAVAHLQPGGAFPLKDLESSLKGIETALSVQVLAVGDGSYRIIGR